MIYIYQKTTGPWICGDNPDLIKKLEPMRLVANGELVTVRRVVNDSVFIAETNANTIAKDAVGNLYANYAELYTATADLFFEEGEAIPDSAASKIEKIKIVGVDLQTDYEMPVDTDIEGWIVALNPIEVDAVLIEELGVKKIRFSEALATGDNATVIYNKL